jgi:hypothetical protein
LFSGNCCLLLLSSLSNPAAIVSSSMEGVMHTDGGTGTIVRLCDRALVDPVLGDDVVPTLTSAKHERLRDSIESERLRNQSLLLQRRLVRYSDGVGLLRSPRLLPLKTAHSCTRNKWWRN